MIPINVVVEGLSDKAVANQILIETRKDFVPLFHIKGGKSNIVKKFAAYNYSARTQYWFVLMDIDNPKKCPSAVIQEMASELNPGMCFRLAIPQIESWLIADRRGLSKFLGISVDLITTYPDQLPNAKTEMVNLAYKSTKRLIRNDMVLETKNSIEPGLGYSLRLSEFASKHWNVHEASLNSPSLAKCINALKKLAHVKLH